MSAPVDNYFEQGMALFEQGDYEQAIESLTKALRLSLGDLAEAHLYRGIAYAYLEDDEHALEDFNEALQRNPYLADGYNERGSLLRLNGYSERAIEDFTMAIRLEATHYAAYFNRALAHESLQNYAQAEQDLTQSIEHNRSNPSCYEVRGRIRALLRDYEGAIADFERYIRMGGGREFDNQSEVQAFILSLRVYHFASRIIPSQFLPIPRM